MIWRWAMVALLIAAALLLAATTHAFIRAARDDGPRFASGMAVLDAHRCRLGETRHLLLRGAEDNFSSEGDEPARPINIEARRNAFVDAVGYDATRTDGAFGDHFDLPPHITSALFVTRLRALGENSNDEFRIGNLNGAERWEDGDADSLRSRPTLLAQTAGWHHQDDIYWASLSDVTLQSGRSALDYARDDQAPRTLDILVADDTAVDFIGLALCTAPQTNDGLTHWFDMPVDRVARARCSASEGQACNPYLGDTSCDDRRALACFRPDSLTVPQAAARHPMVGAEDWTGGEIALTAPIAASRFATIADADAFCQQTFGADWRVADFHLSGRANRFIGSSNQSIAPQWAWIDIRDQPYGTCWSRRAP